ncbi:hypothetical protein [Fulvimarina endophytica]|nr:hypothetical protein [Fulvimarina endophytica]
MTRSFGTRLRSFFSELTREAGNRTPRLEQSLRQHADARARTGE